MNNKHEYIINLPTKRIAVGVLLLNQKSEFLIVEQSYRDTWSLPGGTVDAHESPLQALKREIYEEIKIDVSIKRCILIDYTNEKIGNRTDESIQLLFLGEHTKNEPIAIDSEEITDYKWSNFDEAKTLLNPKITKRLEHIFSEENIHTIQCILTENGEKIL